jgi:hypothetical protein
VTEDQKEDHTRVCSACGCVVADWTLHRKYHDVTSATWEGLASWVADHGDKDAPSEAGRLGRAEKKDTES